MNLKQAKVTHEEVLKTVETARDESQSELVRKNETVRLLEGELDKEREKTQTLENENRHLVNELDGKTKELEASSRRLDQEIIDLTRARQELPGELAKRNEIIQTLETKAVELEKKSKGLELEINRLNAVLEEAKGEGIKEQMAFDNYTLTLKGELDKKEKFIQNVAKEVERQREIVKVLELERTQLKNDLDESGRNHQNSLRLLTAGDKASKGLIDGLESAQALLKEKNDEVEKLTSELANRVGELEKENKKVQNLEQEIASLQISLKESKGEHDKVLQELAKSNETIKKSNNELTELRRKNEVLVRENSSLKSGLDGAEKKPR